jgi:hypothetical protein
MWRVGRSYPCHFESSLRFADNWCEELAGTLRAEGFTPSLADPDVWMRDAGDMWEYICVYVDDLFAADPKAFADRLRSDPWNYKLKRRDEPTYHLGGDFRRDPGGTLAYSAQTYVERMVKNDETIFGEKPREYRAPAAKEYHPELDSSEFCDEDDTAKFQSLIGALQWTVSLCRFDVAVAVMTMGRYRTAFGGS